MGGIKINYRFSIILPAYNVENHIRDTLNSLVNQSFQDFEVILVNDGSTDSTQDIINEYCNKYSNFKYIYQENQGVAVARNNALKLVTGEYIGFLDPDGDLFFEEALYNINETIKFHKSQNTIPDLIIGPQTSFDTWSRREYKNAKILSHLDNILPHDEKIIWTMLILNKMFRREKLIETGVKMPLLTHSSDAGFFFSYLYQCDKIVGCPHDFLLYKKRLFSDDSSLSQDSNLDSVNSYYKSYKIILNTFQEYCDKYKIKLIKQGRKSEIAGFNRYMLNYIDTLRYKECTALFIKITYRFFWKSDDKTLKRVKEIIDELKEDMFPPTWEKCVKSNNDLNLNSLITSHEEMAKNPIISIVLGNLKVDSNKDSDINNFNINKTSLNRIIHNIYNSHFPAFELIVPNEFKSILDDNVINKENIKFIESNYSHDFKNKAIELSKGKYMIFIEEDILFSPNLFKKMFDKINISDYDWVMDPMCSVIEDKFSNNDTYNVNMFSKRELINSNTEYDCFLSDKLFNKEFLKNNDFKFSNDIQVDIKRLYEIGKYKKINANFILTNNEYLKTPFISLIIDDMDISNENLNKLLESIYTQNFNSFDVILNGKLKSKINEEFLEKSNLSILETIEKFNFKKIAIERSKSKYGFFIDIPLYLGSNSLKNLFFDIEKKQLNIKRSDKIRYAFTSSPFYYFNDNDGDKKLIKIFSSNLLAYTYKDLNYSSYKSRFMIFDLYLSNKLFNLDILIENDVYFENPHEDVLNFYKNFKFSKINQKSILTSLNQKNLFKSGFGNRKIPFLINFQYYVHKFIFSIIILRRNLKNIAN